MEAKLRYDDSLRICTCDNNFVDLKTTDREEIVVDMYTHFHYIEIRKKKVI